MATQTGGSLTDGKIELFLKCFQRTRSNCDKAMFYIRDENKISRPANESLILYMFENDSRSYQERWYHFNVIKQTAATSLPKIPFSWFIINMQMASRAYLKGFKHMDNQKQKKPMKLRKQHFKYLLETIKNYQ